LGIGIFSALVVDPDLPVGERLGSGTDVGDVGVDAGGELGAIGRALALGEPGGLVIPLCDPRLLALPFIGRRS
jgi:hypothetical protein